MFVIFQKFVIVLEERSKCMNVTNIFNSIEYIKVTLQ